MLGHPMARQVNRLSARSAATVTKPGRHADGNGLYLMVDPSGAKRWLFLFRWGGKLKETGLGGLSTVSLGDAPGQGRGGAPAPREWEEPYRSAPSSLFGARDWHYVRGIC